VLRTWAKTALRVPPFSNDMIKKGGQNSVITGGHF